MTIATLPLAEVVNAYLGAALFTGMDPEGRTLEYLNYELDDFSAEARAKAEEDCADFLSANAELLEGLTPSAAGTNFWFTRNRHGAGFRDLGLGERGRKLTEMAHPYGSCEVSIDGEQLSLT